MSIFDDVFEGASGFVDGLSKFSNSVLDAAAGATEKIGKVAQIGATYQTAPVDNGSGLNSGNNLVNFALIFGAIAVLLVVSDN